jgi:hypothetical protein
MTVASKAAAIQAFWAWWSTARLRIEQAISSGPRPDLVEEITSNVHAIDAGLAWELGAGQRAAHALCVTPEGRPELRSVTERWVRAGPAADAVWEYHPARTASSSTSGSTIPLPARTGPGGGRPEIPDRVEQLQDELETLLGEQAVLVVRETRSDHRSLHLYCDAEGRVPDMVESWRLAQPLPVTAVWEHDPAWSAVRPFR